MKNVKYAYYGLGHSNTYLAIRKYLLEKGYSLLDDYLFLDADKKIQIDLISCKDIDSLRDNIKQKNVDRAILPIVNSDSGVIPFSSNLIFNENFEVMDIITDKIQLYLYGLKQINDYSKIKGIISNLPALSQCSHFVNKNMPFATYIKASSTTEAVKMLLEKNDPDYVCIANKSAEKNESLVKLSTNTINRDIVSNGGETQTKFLLIKQRTTDKKRVKDMLVGYYVYQSKSSELSNSSVSPASFRVIQISKENHTYKIRGFVFGFKCEELFSSNITAISKSKDNYSFFYEYDNKHEDKTVNGLARITINIPSFLKTGRMYGIYCGYGNNKAGTLEFAKITKNEFDLYMEGLYGNKNI